MTIYLGLGSNLGDRQSNILHALQRLRRDLTIEAVSDYYESPPALGAQGPAYLNVAVQARSDIAPAALGAVVKDVERTVGRRDRVPLHARPIDIDILLVVGVRANFDDFTVPHPRLAERPFNVVPLAEIAPDVIETNSGLSFAALAARDGGNVRRVDRSLRFVSNRQDDVPAVLLAVDRVGVANLRRIVPLTFGERTLAVEAVFTMCADLSPERAGLHMSRFAELLASATLDVLDAGDPPSEVGALAVSIASAAVASHGATRADVKLRVPLPLERWTPVSGKRGEELYACVAIAHAEGPRVRYAIGVEAEGMTACPCAQEMVREHSIRELRAAGFSDDEAQRALAALPVATHNQRGRGAVLLGVAGPQCDADARRGKDSGKGRVRPDDLVEIVESAMSSETYDMLKRPDEFFIVNKAHRHPKFVEDVVRDILAGALGMYCDFPDDAFLFASQLNYESIHKHDVLAEAFGTFGELRDELRTGVAGGHRTDLAGWLGTRPSEVTSSVWNR